MKPKITSTKAWQQAELLMQPALIRVLDNIRKQLDESIWNGTYHEKQTPFPGYQLLLEHGDKQRYVDIWELCYQVCFINYNPTHSEMESREVEIDTSLIEEDTGDVDWNRLDAKASELIQAIFDSLPR
ncbi:MAG: hypothetical protein HC786_29895 [Richelia sp. CSU_2_1]|nr:hypothetical protein [Microcoleus sp. SU_5_6]NJL68513.1 hypothetical protein [Microcoleus sp. SM1_3_4]NJR26020.1 hypothetical protein [Richelia sp. CSU_2_1]